MTLKRMQALLFAVIVGIVAALPATANAVPTDDPTVVADERITVRVVNNNWSDMRVYIVQEGSTLYRLGTVTSFTTSRFDVPRWFNPSGDQLVLFARGIGSRQSTATAPILVNYGDLVELRIENNIGTTNIRVVSGSN